ncbi:MAG: hypothetical protein K0R96_1722 [Pantoea agglomerans]|jgi:hypothetical protein|nr:hypothetical protein [Pantoea agglomerans]
MILVIAQQSDCWRAANFHSKNKVSPPFSMILRNKIILSKEPV